MKHEKQFKERVEELKEWTMLLPSEIRRDVDAILDDHAERLESTKETKAGGTEKISGSQNDASRPAPRHVPPGPADADERALAWLKELELSVLAYGTDEIVVSEGWQDTMAVALAHLRSRLAAPRVSRGRLDKALSIYLVPTPEGSHIKEEDVERFLFRLGVVVDERGEEENNDERAI